MHHISRTYRRLIVIAAAALTAACANSAATTNLQLRSSGVAQGAGSERTISASIIRTKPASRLRPSLPVFAATTSVGCT